jgi:hypothetical protein
VEIALNGILNPSPLSYLSQGVKNGKIAPFFAKIQGILDSLECVEEWERKDP